MQPDLTAGVVVVGSGHGGVQVADSLRAGGHDGPVTLVDRAPDLPYQRPPLSKEGLTDADAVTLLRGPDFYAEARIERRHATVTGLDLAACTVLLDDGDPLPYGALVLATGSSARRLDVLGADLDGVVGLRTRGDARRLADRLEQAEWLVVVGAGFIGLEVAAVAVGRGLEVVVLESADRPMARALTPGTSAWFRDALPDEGVAVRYGAAVERFEGDGQVRGVRLADGEVIAADVVLVGVGARADTTLAEAAGLEVADGVLVDGSLRTSDPHVLAVGDCARYPAGPAGSVRLESVQNATAHGRHVAAVLLGTDTGEYAEVPWFWSHQGRLRLQIAGLARDGLTAVVRGDPASRRFSVLGYDDDVLVCVESVGAPGDHLAARRLLAAGRSPDPADVADPDFDLKAFSRAATS